MIAFRIFDKKTNSFLQSSYVEDLKAHLYINIDGSLSAFSEVFSANASALGDIEINITDRFIIRQYADITDINDNKIYDGDIIQLSDWQDFNREEFPDIIPPYYQVYWNSTSWSAKCISHSEKEINQFDRQTKYFDSDLLYRYSRWGMEDKGRLVVIGNIDKNPELLKL